MTIIKFLRILNRNMRYMMASSFIIAVLVFLSSRNKPKEYESETEIYTGIASGLNVSSVAKSNIDFFSTSNAFDNLMNIIRSRQTLEEVGENLLAIHVSLDGPEPGIIEEEAWNHMMELLTPDVFLELKSSKGFDSTLVNVKKFKAQYGATFRGKIIFYNSESPYSFHSIKNMSVMRMANSDFINIKYKYKDPGIVKSTLEILSEIFIRRMYDVKIGQSNDVVEYFRQEVQAAKEALMDAEEKLKEFNIKNRIINYGEQTKSIAMMKEQMEDNYQRELAERASNKASLEKLEKQLEINKVIIRFSDELLQKRKELIDLTAQITSMEVYYNDFETISVLKQKAANLRAELSNSLSNRYLFSKTTEGVPNQAVLQEWLKYTLALDESEAKLKIFDARREYFKEVYDEFSPLGSIIARMEREISVQESNYLELLHSLNQAIMRQQSERVQAGGIIVTVPPYFPLKPLPSKTIIMVLAAGMVGFIVPFAIIILLEFFDTTLKNPIRAQSVLARRLFGTFPNFIKNSRNKNTDIQWVQKQSLGLMIQSIRLESFEQRDKYKRPFMIGLVSTRDMEGKSTLSNFIANELVNLQYKVLVLTPSEVLPDVNIFYERVQYPLDKTFERAQDVKEIIPANIPHTLYDYLILELPNLMNNQYPLHITMQMQLNLLLVRANRAWAKADEFTLKEFSRALSSEVRFILNRVEIDELEEVLGDIPKKRGTWRKLLKRMITGQFRG